MKQRDTFGDAVAEYFVKNWLLWIALALAFAAIRIIAAGAAQVTLAWNASSDPIVTGYNVYYGGKSGVYTNEVSAGDSNSVTIFGLIEGKVYFFAATAESASGVESPFSSEVSYLVPPARAVLTWSNTYIMVVRTNAPGFYTNRLHQVKPIPPYSTNAVFTGFWISCPLSGPWKIQESTNLRTWVDFISGTNNPHVYFTNNGGTLFLRLAY
jgi:hypothetical protein